jgi:hypothetical protein
MEAAVTPEDNMKLKIKVMNERRAVGDMGPTVQWRSTQSPGPAPLPCQEGMAFPENSTMAQKCLLGQAWAPSSPFPWASTLW